MILRKEKAKHFISTIEAWLNNEDIQYRASNGEWIDKIDNPDQLRIDNGLEYRKKPEKPEPYYVHFENIADINECTGSIIVDKYDNLHIIRNGGIEFNGFTNELLIYLKGPLQYITPAEAFRRFKFYEKDIDFNNLNPVGKLIGI